MAAYVSFPATDIPSRSPHDMEVQGSLFGQLPRGLPFFKEEAAEGEVFRRLANRLPLPAAPVLH